MKSFRIIGKGQASAKVLTLYHKKFKFIFRKGDIFEFERMKDDDGFYFRIYPTGEFVKYDTCSPKVFEKLFRIENEYTKNIRKGKS